MSISAMLDGGTLPPPSMPRNTQPDLSPLKAPFTDYMSMDRTRDVGSSSASPGGSSTSMQALGGPKPNRITPPDPVYRAHHQLQHHSTQSLDRDPQYSRSIYEQQRVLTQPPPPPPPRPLSQPHSLPGMRDDGQQQQRHYRSGSYSGRDVYGERERRPEPERRFEKEMERERERERDREMERREREREREMEREREREHRERERIAREAEARERQLLEQEQREREQRERERREQERREQEQREREQREREQRERERERERERARERELQRERERVREHIGAQYSVGSAFGSERMEVQNPPTSSSHPPYGMTITSRFQGGQNGVPQSTAPPAGSISIPTTVSLPPNPGPGQGQNFGHSQRAAASSGHRESFQPFSGYAVSMPPSPFSITNTMPLPAVGDDARDRDARPQRFKPPRETSLGGRDEPLRAEDALSRGFGRSLSSLMEDEKKRNIGKDRDGIIRDKNGIMRLTDSALTYQSPPRRSAGLGMEANTIVRDWGDLPKETDRGGGMSMKRDREDDESSASKTEKKKRHHHHHQHPHQSVPPIPRDPALARRLFDAELTSFSHPSHYHHHHDEQPSHNLDAPKASVSVRSKSPLHAHHHHIHHHHTASQQQTPLSKATTTLLIDSSKVLASLTSKPRNYLGSMVYLPTHTPKEGYSVTHPLLPRFEGRENSIFQIRIPKRFLSDSHRRDVCRRRCLWGTEIYSDDSDIVAVLIHIGKIPGWLPEDVDPALVKGSGRRIVIRGALSASGASSPTNSSSGKCKTNGIVAAKKAEGKEREKEEEDVPEIPAGKDLLVNLLILPALERYSGSVRYSLKSRSWNTIHDGMSYSIWDMQWAEAGAAESRGGGSRKRRLDEREWVRRWGELPTSKGGAGKGGEWAKVEKWSHTESENGKGNGEVEVGA